MSFRARTTLLALLAAMGLALLVPVGAGAAEFPGIEKFAAINCKAEFENCAHKLVPKTIPYPVYAAILGPQTYSVTEEPKSLEESQEQGFTTAAGHVPFGVTDFKVATIGTKGEPGGELPQQIPTELVTHIRTDVAAGLATSPTAMPLCSGQSFGEKETPGSFGIEEIPGSGLFTAPKCVKASEVGVNEATVYVEAPKVSPPEEPGVAKFDLALSGKVYNLDPPKGRASLFGVALKLPIALTKGKLEKAFAELGNPFGPELETKWETEQWYAHTLIEGNVEWGKEAAGTEAGDYHDYFEINVSPELPLISSRLVFFGNREGEEGQTGDFITNATRCPGHETTTLKITDKEGVTVPRPYTNPFVHLSECEKVPFEPLFTLSPATTAHDTPDGFSTTLALTRHPKAAEQDSSELDNAEFTLPEGMTLNPSAAAGLTACTPAQARIHSPVPGVACPASSEVGTVTLNVPTLPPGSLVGKLYLGGPESGPITAPPYTMYLDAESERYGVSVRLEGKVIPNPVTGRITTVFTENPEQPFTNVTFHFKEGALAPVANPLVCGSAQVTTALTPYSGTGTVTPLSNPFTFDLNGAGGACASPPPFTPSQSTSETPTTGGSHSSFTFNLERGDGNQYFSEVKTTLPEGLVGAIPAATQCGEPGASKGECPSTSQIGEATVLAGAGPTPYAFKGPVYLTGPYNGAPFGMSIPVPAVAGPFNLGTIVTRATINVDQSTARVIVGSVLPRIVGGVPVRLKKITVQITKSGFLSNPTNCTTPLATESSVSGFTPETGQTGLATLSSPFTVANCSALPFKPSFKATTNAHYTRAGGASLETTLNLPPGGANVKSVLVQLPSQLPSRQSTFSKACLIAVFNANPSNCGAAIGGVRANTPLLPSKMSGPVYFVAVGGAQFPDLDLVLNANGVRVVVVGETKITKGITTTHFSMTPDAYVSSITVNLPTGRLSALAGFGNLCRHRLYMPTTIEGQNGKVFKQNTRIHVKGCPVQIVGHKVVGRSVYLTVSTPGAGRLTATGRGVRTARRRLRGAVEATRLKVSLAGGRRGPLRTRIRVGFRPSSHSLKPSAAFITVTLR